MPSSVNKPERRIFLQRSLAVVPAAALPAAAGLAGCDTAPPRVTGGAAAPKGAAGRLSQHQARSFNKQEWRFVIAACARLIPDDDDGPGALGCGVPVFIDRQLDGPYGYAANWYMQGPFHQGAPEFGYQGRATPRELYHAGIAAVDALCLQRHAKAFAELEPAQQDETLQQLEDGNLQAEGVDLKTFFKLLSDDTRYGFLADPIHGGNRDMAAWKMIGFPGARADFLEWTTRHGQAYPLGPVSIAGQRG
ncbi:MAG: gluconate 2-dehydrogenase subunit 3 family protein [Burkholderiales bacterium]|nr:gluconate 2-dehydrogenase subunit 3 family protein [Burkholderiales bacterium]